MTDDNVNYAFPVTHSLMESVADTTAHRDRDSLNGAIAQLLLDFLAANSVTVYRLIKDEDTTRLLTVVVALRGIHDTKPALSDDPTNATALDSEPYWSDSVRLREAKQYLERSDAGSVAVAVFPIEGAREVIGLLVLKGSDPLIKRELQLVFSILRILKNHVDLLDYGERDTLTHMLNRKTFESRFTKLRQRLRSTDTPCAPNDTSWLGLVDIDKFKSINDSHGHLFGDEILLLISQIMRECFRGADQLFRFGGEEFVIVLDHATAAGADIAFDRLRAAVEAYKFPQVGRVTISLGYSQIRPDDGPTSCVERADAALYYAKHHGRNKNCHYECLIEEGALVARPESETPELF
jgi:diguanylate cyclase (GGDEF)-like protein